MLNRQGNNPTSLKLCNCTKCYYTECMLNIVLASSFYALFQVLAAYAAQKLSDMWFVIGGTISVAAFTILVVGLRILNGTHLGKLTPVGLLLIFIANGGVTLFSLFLSRSFQQFDAKLVIPLVFGGAIFVSTIVDAILHRSLPSTAQMVSLLLISGGLVLLGVQGK